MLHIDVCFAYIENNQLLSDGENRHAFVDS